MHVPESVCEVAVSLIVFMRGVNVGGHRTFRPSVLASGMRELDVVNVGAAGTFVVRKRIGRAKLRAELLKRVPFEAKIMICTGDEILDLIASDPFASQPAKPDIVRFVSVLAKPSQALISTPADIPPSGEWSVKILATKGPFVLGLYRRNMKAIGYLGQLDRILGVPATTRNWNTITTLARIVVQTNLNS